MAEDDLVTRRGLRVPGAAVSWRATRSGGPGGQHANTSDTLVTVELDVAAAELPPGVEARLRAAHGPVVRVSTSESRSQFRNRQLARARLAALIDDAAIVPTTRRATRPTRSSARRRLDDKRRAGDRKRERSWRPDRD